MCQSMKFRLKLISVWANEGTPNIPYHFGHFSRVGGLFLNKKIPNSKKIVGIKKISLLLLKIKILN